MRVVEADQALWPAWNAFVAGQAQGSFYHRFEWQEINRSCFGHETAFLTALDGTDIVGVFPLVHVKSRLFGSIACSMPFVNYGGPCAATDTAEQALLAAAAERAEAWEVDYLEIRSRRHLGSRYPTAEHKVSLNVALDPDPDKLFAGFKTGHRTEIRRAYKNGFHARFGGLELVDDFYAVLCESWRDLGTPLYQKEYLLAVARTFLGEFRICVVYTADGVPAAAAFDGLHGDTIEGMWMGTINKYRSMHVGYVLYWELIKDGCTRGFRTFHLGRSTVHSGGETFKKKWNAQSDQLYWQYVLRTRQELPGLNVQSSKYRLAMQAWRRLPIGVTRMVGPLLARSIP